MVVVYVVSGNSKLQRVEREHGDQPAVDHRSAEKLRKVGINIGNGGGGAKPKARPINRGA